MKRATFWWLPVLLLGAGGCGPSDGSLASRVDSTLAADDSVGMVRLTVDSRDRVVTLTGRVPNQELRRRAVQLARQTTGVVDVIDRTVVQAPSSSPAGGPTPTRRRTMGHGERH